MQYQYFSYGIAVLGTPSNAPRSMALLFNLGPLTRNARWNVSNEIHAAHTQSTWSEAEFIIIIRNNIKLFHFTISGDRKIVFFFTHISRIC